MRWSYIVGREGGFFKLRERIGDEAIATAAKNNGRMAAPRDHAFLTLRVPSGCVSSVLGDKLYAFANYLFIQVWLGNASRVSVSLF